MQFTFEKIFNALPIVFLSNIGVRSKQLTMIHIKFKVVGTRFSSTSQFHWSKMTMTSIHMMIVKSSRPIKILLTTALTFQLIQARKNATNGSTTSQHSKIPS